MGASVILRRYAERVPSGASGSGRLALVTYVNHHSSSLGGCARGADPGWGGRLSAYEIDRAQAVSADVVGSAGSTASGEAMGAVMICSRDSTDRTISSIACPTGIPLRCDPSR